MEVRRGHPRTASQQAEPAQATQALGKRQSVAGRCGRRVTDFPPGALQSGEPDAPAALTGLSMAARQSFSILSTVSTPFPRSP